MEILGSAEALVAAGWEEWRLLEQEKQSSMICLTQAIPSADSQNWQHAATRIDTSQLDNWHSVFQSAKEVLVTSFEILDIRKCVRDGFLRASQLNTKHTEKSFLLSCLHVLKLRERPSYPILLHQMKPGSIIVNWRQGSPWNGTILNLPGGEEKKRKKNVPVRRQDHDHSLLGLPRSDSCGCDASRGHSHLQCLHQNTYRTQEASQTSVASQEPNVNLSSAWQCKAAHKFEESGTHHKILLDSVTPSTLQPWSSILRFPPIWSPEGCNLLYKVWDWWYDMICTVGTLLFEQDKAWYSESVHTLVP